ncbi:17794_t:CDS:1, partial [Racocetra persica]
YDHNPVRVHIYIDIELNTVFIALIYWDKEINITFLNAIRPYEQTVHFITPPNANPRALQTKKSDIDQITIDQIVTPIIGGEGLFSNNTLNGTFCSVGFSARSIKDANVKYIVAAGHCINKKITTEQNLFLVFHGATTILILRPI